MNFARSMHLYKNHLHLTWENVFFVRNVFSVFPNKIRFTTDYKIATNDLNNLIINDDTEKNHFQRKPYQERGTAIIFRFSKTQANFGRGRQQQ